MRLRSVAIFILSTRFIQDETFINQSVGRSNGEHVVGPCVAWSDHWISRSADLAQAVKMVEQSARIYTHE